MNTQAKIFLAILIVLSVASGITKVLLLPQDVEFFVRVGMTNGLLIFFGIVQIISGIALVFEKVRILGLAVFVVTFVFSTVLIFMDNNLVSGVLSLWPVLIAVHLIQDSR